MSLELCVLGSGSSGNASILRAPAGAMLIDAGLGPRVIAQRMSGTGTALCDLRAIVLTHLDSDHFTAHWCATIVRCGIEIYCHSQRMNDLIGIARRSGFNEDGKATDIFRSLVRPFGRAPFTPLPHVKFTALPLAHDRTGSHAFVIDGHSVRIGFATDLGHVPPLMIDAFEDLDVIAIESNYDPAMQFESGRPHFLQRRIMNGAGHLSNEQALSAVREILDRHERAGRRLPEHVVLLHRSRQCNCPKLVRRLFSSDARITSRLTIAEPFARSEWLRSAALRPRVGEQLHLFMIAE